MEIMKISYNITIEMLIEFYKKNEGERIEEGLREYSVAGGQGF